MSQILYTQFTLFQIWQPTTFFQKSLKLHTFHKTTLCTYIYSFIIIQSISLHKIVLIQHKYISQENPKLLQHPACLYLENSFLKQANNELNELSECMLYKRISFLKISQNGKTLFTRYFPEILLALLKKFLKHFILACLLCFPFL